MKSDLIQVKSQILPGSVVKAEKVAREVRSRLNRISLERLEASLRLSSLRRAKMLSRFLRHLRTFYLNHDLEQLYVLRSGRRKKFRYGARGAAKPVISRYFRFAVLLRKRND